MTVAVSVVEPVGGHGGMNYYDLGLCRGLIGAGLQPLFFTCDETSVTGKEGFEVSLSYRAIYGPDPAWKRGLRFVAGSFRALVGSRLRGSLIAHFHFFQVGPLELFNVLLARMLLMRVVITAHDVEAFKEGLSVKRFVDWAYRMAHGVIAHNQVSRRELVEIVGVPDQKISVIPHGNYIDYFVQGIEAEAARRRIGAGRDDFVILFFGQIKDVKGVDVLLRAIPAVKAGCKCSVRLVIAGKMWKSDFSKYEQLIDQLGIKDDCVLHIRYIPDEELPWYYAAADVVALPYKRIYQSGVVLMAMSFGKPVVVSDIPGMLEVVSHMKTGLVFESGNPVSLAEQLLVAANDREALDEIAQRGYRHMVDEYSWREIGLQTAECYGRIL